MLTPANRRKRASVTTMVILTLGFSDESPELIHEEIEAQIAELEREFGAEQS
jgi:hypothetical protein